jgi:hypothetical protein
MERLHNFFVYVTKDISILFHLMASSVCVCVSPFSLFIYTFISFLLQPVQDPKKMTQIIVEALETTGQRGIISKGWGGLGNCKDIAYSCFHLSIVYYFYVSLTKCFFPVTEPKDSIYSLDNIPHDWLFLHCKAVVRSSSSILLVQHFF